MKHAEKADQLAFSTSLAIDLLTEFRYPKNIVKEIKVYITTIKRDYVNLNAINLTEVQAEFWELLDELEHKERIISLYEVKFEKLLALEDNHRMNSEAAIKIGDTELLPFFARHREHGLLFTEEEVTELVGIYGLLVYLLIHVKSEIVSLLKQGNAVIKKDNQDKITPPVITPKYRIAKSRKTDFIKVISAMYDARLFETQEGFIASSKQDVMNEFGQLLGEDFKKYSTTLSQAKNAELNSFLKPFKELEKRAKEYFEKGVEE